MTPAPRLPLALRLSLLVLPAALGLLVLPGCEGESYSEDVEYRVRTDPILMEPLPGVRLAQPDRPGQLPLLRMSQVNELAELLPDGSLEKVTNTLRDPNKLDEKDRDNLQRALDNIFGTPAHPKLNVKGEGPAALGKLLRVGKRSLEESLAYGSKVYRLQCQMCHGVTGDGRGPTGPWVNPHPRDYRLGKFKFQSVDQAADNTQRKPAKADLVRTIRNGIESTAMPAFNLLPDEQIEAVASYVIFLSLRGETELQAFKEGMRDEGGRLVPSGSLAKTVREAAKAFSAAWDEAQGKPIQAVPYPKYTDEQRRASIERGAALFRADAAQIVKLFPELAKEPAKLEKLKGASCVSCHEDYGRLAVFRFDDWGTMTRPANLTAGVYRGGRRPIDLYWRIHSGINGSGMNVFGDVLTGEQIWDVVNFVRMLPYPAMRKEYGINIH